MYNPYANKLLLHLLAAFAEHEREQISTRTKEALKAAKQRGAVLGKNGRYKLSKDNKIAASEFARLVQPIIQEIKYQRFITTREITAELNN
ncbi:recombinase family protein [Emticicia sp. W12TSBA100-4]|uniref:recombinase family protein n=1 Tax=Emticicia sp. W12TSBA100-4 TaxID=3160965 RepID=UPI0033067546